ncbi:MAG: hypothetical protein ACOC0E_04200 [Spirochaetota bacterium]
MAQEKPPKPFNKPLPHKRYRKRLRDRIYLERDRAFLDEITKSDSSGNIVLGRDLSKEERARLKKLVKEARKNRGAIRMGKLAVLGLLVAGVVVFNLVFKDRLVERGAERLLETIFRARADLSGVDFRPLAGHVSFDSLEVADASAPMTNLFETSAGGFSVDTWLLLSGRYLVRDVTVAGLAFGTPRETSGEIARPARPHDSDPADDEVPPEADAAPSPIGEISLRSLGLPDTLDARAVIDDQTALLNAPTAVTELLESGSTYVARWEDEIATLTDAGVASADRLRELASTDFSAIRSVDAAVRLLEQTEATVESTSAYAERVEAAVDGAIAEARTISQDAASLPAVVEADIQGVLDRIPDVQAEGEAFMAGLVESFLRRHLGSWYDRALQGYDYFGRLRSLADETPRARTRRAGRIVNYPTVAYPVFQVDQLYLSAEAERTLELTVEAISSDADLTGRPTTISYRDGDALSIGGVFDARTNTETPISIAVSATGAPVSLSHGLDALDLDRFDARADIKFTLLTTSDGSSGGRIDVSTRGITIAGAPEPNSIGELVRDVLTRAQALVAGFSYSIDSGGAFAFSDGSTNLDDQIAGLVQERIDATLAAFEQRVRDELDALIEPQLAALEDSLGDVLDVRAAAEELLELATDREAAAAALQDRAANAAESIRASAEAEAQRRIDEAQRQAEAAAREAEAAARAEAERAAREAEESAREQVEDIRDQLGLPGF